MTGEAALQVTRCRIVRLFRTILFGDRGVVWQGAGVARWYACPGGHMFLLLAALACTSPDDSDVEAVYGAEALAFVEERIVGTFWGEWQMFGLDESDAPVALYAWTDQVIGSNPRLEDDRALADIVDSMDGGSWTQEVAFLEGVYVDEDGGMGAYFIERDGTPTIVNEVEENHWEYLANLTESDLQTMDNVNSGNLIDGWKTSTKLVTWVDGWERHDVSVLTHVEYENDEGEPVVADFTSLSGYHQKHD